MKSGAQIYHVDKNWWQQERTPTQQKKLIVAKRRSKITYPLLTVKQVSEKLNVGVGSIYSYIISGELDCQIVGKRKRISEEDLEDFLILQKNKHLKG